MKMSFVNRDLVFYPLAFVLWAVAVIAANAGHPYFGSPRPSADLGKNLAPAFNIDQARAALAAARTPQERGRILDALAAYFFNRYAKERSPAFLDSAQSCILAAIKASPGAPENYLNLARIYTEKKDFPSAQAAYEKSAEADPKNFTAYHNLGFLAYYELKNPTLARKYFEKALSIDSAVPVDNYMIARIATEQKDLKTAALHYKRELDLYAAARNAKAGGPGAADPNSRLAATLSALELAMLYSTVAPDKQQARALFDSYLALETDPQRRQNSIERFLSRWPGTKLPAAP
jgi:tetratricopeptide (TPR) repeat protein